MFETVGRPLLDSLLFFLPIVGLPIGAIRERFDCEPSVELVREGEFAWDWTVGPPKKLNDAADGDGEFVAPEMDPALECSKIPIDPLFPGSVRPRSPCCVILWVRE